MIDKVRQKIKSRAGESLAETLVSLLIASCALVMLAGTLSAASGIIIKGRDRLKAYYSENELPGGVVKRGSEGTEPAGTEDIIIKDKENNFTQSFNVTYYKNDKFARKPVIAYKVKEATGTDSQSADPQSISP